LTAWLCYYAGVVEPVVTAKFQGRTETDPDEKRAYDALDARLRAALRAGPYLLGDAFSAADVLLPRAVSSGFPSSAR
jgi:glutathione S-transferase